MLVAQDLSKRYDKVLALDDVSFKVEKGEVFGLLGENGAGKTTAMKIFATILKPTSGKASVCGIDVTKDPIEVKRRIGYTPETPSLYERLTAREFLTLVGSMRGMDDDRMSERVERLGKALEIEEVLDGQLGTFSRGMRQKVSFAASIVHSPEVLILDEPITGLDPRFGKFIKLWLKEYALKGNTILLSTHITTFAEDICDRVAVIHKGRIAGIGTPKELAAKCGVANLEEAFVKLVGGLEWHGLE